MKKNVYRHNVFQINNFCDLERHKRRKKFCPKDFHFPFRSADAFLCSIIYLNFYYYHQFNFVRLRPYSIFPSTLIFTMMMKITRLVFTTRRFHCKVQGFLNFIHKGSFKKTSRLRNFLYYLLTFCLLFAYHLLISFSLLSFLMLTMEEKAEK